MRGNGGVADETDLAARREESQFDIVVGRVGTEHEGDFGAREFTRDATHLLLVEHVRVEDDGGRIAAEAFAREGVDMKQAAFALGHGGAGSPGPGEDAH